MKKALIFALLTISSTVFAGAPPDYLQPEDPSMGPNGLTCHANRFSFVSDVPGSTVAIDGGIESAGGGTFPAENANLAGYLFLGGDGGTHKFTLHEGNVTVSFDVYFDVDTNTWPSDHLNYCRLRISQKPNLGHLEKSGFINDGAVKILPETAIVESVRENAPIAGIAR